MSLSTRARFRPYFDVGNVSASGSGMKSVSVDDSLLELLGLEPTTRSIISLCESVSTSERDEASCWCTFLSGGFRDKDVVVDYQVFIQGKFSVSLDLENLSFNCLLVFFIAQSSSSLVLVAVLLSHSRLPF